MSLILLLLLTFGNKQISAFGSYNGKFLTKFTYFFYWKKRLEYGLKITLFEKLNFCPKIQFWQNPNIFTSFSPKFFLTIFLVKSKLSTAKKSKTTTFSRVFHSKNRQFSREIKVEFLDKKWRFRTVWKWGFFTLNLLRAPTRISAKLAQLECASCTWEMAFSNGMTFCSGRYSRMPSINTLKSSWK